MPHLFYETPVGTARITETDGFISSVSILDYGADTDEGSSPVLDQAVKQLDEYFAGKRLAFDFPIKQNGTPFQQSVWDELLKIEYAKTISYKELSLRMGDPLAIRAIASANGKNSLWIIVPCHRVIGSNGDLVGYAGGLWRKKWLLEHETKIAGVGQIKLEF